MNMFLAYRGAPSKYVDPLGLTPTDAEAMTEQQLRDRLRQYRESRATGTCNEDLINDLSTNMQANDAFNLYGGRYIYTESGNWIDLLHFFHIASLSWHGGKAQANFAGWVNELMQWLDGDPSGAPLGGNEDLVSNAAGADFADRCQQKGNLEDVVINYFNERFGGIATPPKVGTPNQPAPGVGSTSATGSIPGQNSGGKSSR